MANTTEGGKSLWSKPEGWGMIVLGLIAAGGLFFAWGSVVPFVLSTLMMTFQSIWYMAAAAASILFLGWIATNKQLHCLVWNIYKTTMRGICGMVIELNPIAILMNGIADMKGHLEKLLENLDELRGAKAKLDKKIETNQHDAEQAMRTAQAAKARMDACQRNSPDWMEWNKEMQLATMKAGGLSNMNKKFLPLQINMGKMCDFLSKAAWAADFTIKKAEIDVEYQKSEWEGVQTSMKAMLSAKKAMNGSPEQRELVEQTLEFMERDMSNKVGQMKSIMEVSSTFINAADLENDVQFNKGMEMLDSFMNNGTISLISDAEREHAGGTQSSLGQSYVQMPALSDASKVSVSKW